MSAFGGFEAARPVADAVLYEGYLLYPYRASAQKNRLRWQFGVLVPSAFGGLGERSQFAADVLVEGAVEEVHVLVRFLHLQRRQVRRRNRAGEWVDADEVVVGGVAHRSFEEAVPCEEALTVPLGDTPRSHLLVVPGSTEVEDLADAEGAAAQVQRTRAELRLTLQVWAEEDPRRVRLVLGNASAARPPAAGSSTAGEPDRWAVRATALAVSPLSTHLLLGLPQGRWLSRTAPPPWAAAASRECTADGVWPVLMGGRTARDTVLLSPIILPDSPQVSPESPAALFDATEIDELLTLRTMTLTSEEKAQARATDPRAAAIIDHVDHLPPEVLERLHGAIRSVSPSSPRADLADPPDPGGTSAAPLVVDGVAVEVGAVVQLRPGARRTDAQDMFLADRLARVEAILRDVDGRAHVAVTLLEDPGADLQRETGRFRYFSPDEVVPR